MSKPKFLIKSPEADLRAQYPKHLEIGYIAALAILIVVFYAVPQLGEGMSISTVTDITVEVENIPQTKVNTAPPPPARPSIPIASEDDDIPDDETLDDSIFEFDNALAAPPPPMDDEDEEVPFFKVSKKPVVVVKTQPKYPELARRAGIEGQVVCEIVVGKDGKVKKARVVKSVPMLDEAALSAVKTWVFTPGEQRDRKVAVKMIVPVQFKLKN